MATIDLAHLVATGKAVVEYTGTFNLDPSSAATWYSRSLVLANGGQVIDVVGEALVLSGPNVLGGNPDSDGGWCSFRVRVVAAPDIPVPTGVQAVVTMNNTCPYGVECFIGNPAENGATHYFAYGAHTDISMEGTAREGTTDDGVLFMFTPGYNAGDLVSLAITAAVSQTPAFWTNFRGCGEIIGASDQERPEPAPGYAITQGTDGSRYGVQGGHRWAEPEFGSYTAPTEMPALLVMSGHPGTDNDGVLTMWLVVASEQAVASAVITGGGHTIDVLAATAASGYVTDYNVAYGEPGIQWSAFDIGPEAAMFDGTTPLTLTITLAE